MKFVFEHRTLRRGTLSPKEVAVKRFGLDEASAQGMDALYLDGANQRVLAWPGLPCERPLIRAVLNDALTGAYLRGQLGQDADGLIRMREQNYVLLIHRHGQQVETAVPEEVQGRLSRLYSESETWAGTLEDDGAHCFDPRSPAAGTHFRANVLVGDRAGYADPLLTTPKAVVDAWGGGSSRSHSNKEILQTIWGPVPDENGFPVNRQFYLVEDGRQIFYSAQPGADTVVTTRHAANRTVITYRLPDGLEIERTFFIPQAEQEVPYALEGQLIRVKNTGAQTRNLRLVATGMLGFPHPGALTVDVIYTCVTVQPRVLWAGEQSPMAVAPDYTAAWGEDDQPFNMTVAYDASGKPVFPSAYCLDYAKFIGSGSRERPEHVAFLDNSYPRKGPAFYAVGLDLEVPAQRAVECHSYNGSISVHEGRLVTDAVLCEYLAQLSEKLLTPEWAHAGLAHVKAFQEKYQSAVQVETPVNEVDRLVNMHLPFQIRYQTYVSRSFGLTQKGFRQIGFREIQDLFAAMPFEVAAGRREHMRELIKVWGARIHEFGYADHQFYWDGIEPGRYSDDGLWLFQAIGRYVDLTGDRDILQMEWPVAGTEGRTRRVMDTLEAVLHYSAHISVGRNGMPLIDRADWNDTLNLDGEGVPGPEKERMYREQVEQRLIKEGDPLQSELSESVMNGFLLETARQYMVRFARMLGESERAEKWDTFGEEYIQRLQQAWKGDFFARAYINRPNDADTTYLGGQGDGCSDDPDLPGTYFLNSFSWSILSGVATEEQIKVMFDRLERVLLTPYGLRLTSPVKFGMLMPRTGSGDYAYGDRENGGVFKHATMMAVSALFEAARTVKDRTLAEQLAAMGWDVLQRTAPYLTLTDPFALAGNPRFCTQYTNPATGEHVGPLLSGTAPWMWLSYLRMFGIHFHEGQVKMDPVLPAEWKRAGIRLNVPAGQYQIEIRKPEGAATYADKPVIQVDGKAVEQGILPAFNDSQVHNVEIIMQK